MTRLACLALAACLPTLAALGQMAEQPGVDLEKGSVALADTEPGDGGIVITHVAPNAPRQLSDLTLCFTADIKVERLGASVEMLRLPSDKPEIIVSIGAGGSITLMRGPANDQPTKIEKAINHAGRHSVALVIKRDPRQALSGLWIDGTECASFAIAPGTWDLYYQNITLNSGGTCDGFTTVTNLRLYNRALSRPEIIALAQQDAPKQPQDIIALIGGSEAVALAESGWLEAMLSFQRASTATGVQPLVRDLAWEGDTVFEQKRPLNFGSLAQQLQRIQAQQVMLMFGRQECLERGADGVPAFRDALTKLVQQCPRGVVLIGPVPFEKKEAPLPDLAAKNTVLDLYTQAMSAVATANGGRCVFTSEEWPKSTASWTRDGLTLNDHGTRTLADIIVNALAGSWRPPAVDYARLRPLAQAKEQLWHRYWRPSNWAFLYGDRTAQPSSRDHLNPSVRWFPQELEQYRALIDAKENELWKLSQELGRKLP